MAPSPAESPSPSGGSLGCSFQARTKGHGEPPACARRRASPGGSGRRSLPCQLHSLPSCARQQQPLAPSPGGATATSRSHPPAGHGRGVPAARSLSAALGGASPPPRVIPDVRPLLLRTKHKPAASRHAGKRLFTSRQNYRVSSLPAWPSPGFPRKMEVFNGGK